MRQMNIGVIAILTAIALFPPRQCVAKDLTLNEIAMAMEAAHAQLDELAVRYDVLAPAYKDGVFTQSDRRNSVEFRRSDAKGRFFQRMTETVVDSAGRLRPAVSPADMTDTTIGFDGNVTVSMTPSLGGRDKYNAIIYPGLNAPTLRLTDRILFVHRAAYDMPYSKLFALPDNHFDIADRNATISGVPAIRIDGSVAKGKLRMRLFVAPTRGFLAMCEQWINKDDFVIYEHRLDDLVELKPGVWFPKKILGGDQKTPETTYSTTVRDVSIEPLPASMYRVILPPLTNVSDLVSKTQYTIPAATTAPSATTQGVAETEQRLEQFLRDADRQITGPSTRP